MPRSEPTRLRLIAASLAALALLALGTATAQQPGRGACGGLANVVSAVAPTYVKDACSKVSYKASYGGTGNVSTGNANGCTPSTTNFGTHGDLYSVGNNIHIGSHASGGSVACGTAAAPMNGSFADPCGATSGNSYYSTYTVLWWLASANATCQLAGGGNQITDQSASTQCP